MAGGVIFGRGGSNQSQAYQPIGRVVSPDFTNQAFPPRNGIASPYGPFPAAPNVAADFSVDFTAASPSLPSQVTLTRTTSATYLDSTGTLQTASANVARFEYDGYGSPMGLLLEGSSTNREWPSDLSASDWSGLLGGTTKGTGATSPLGTASTRLIEDTGPNDKGLSRGAGTPGAGDWSNFVYARSVWPAIGSKRYLVLGLGPSGACSAVFDIVDGKVTAYGRSDISARIAYQSNGWWKCMVSQPSATGLSGGAISIALSNTPTPASYNTQGTVNYTGDGVSCIDVCCPQVETQLYSSSFIYSPSGEVTRGADIVSSTDSTWLGYKGWVIETERMLYAVAQTLLGINTAIGLGYSSSDLVTTTDGGTQTGSGVDPRVITRAGIGWDSTPRVSIAANGGAVTTAANTPVTPTNLYFGSTNNGASGLFNGHLRMFGGYATLADADLPSVTVQGAIFNPTVANIGTATGSNSAVAVGAWLKSGDGSSAGANTTTAVGAWLQSGVGSAAGTNTTTATGSWLQAGIGSSAGANTTTATGAWLQSGVGSSAGSNSALAVGAWLQSGVGSSAGTNTATATAAPIQAKVGSATGANTTTAVGAWLQSGVGSSSGSNTATATATWLQSGVGSSSGSNTTTVVGHWLQSGIGSAAGTNTSAGTGAWLFSGVGASVGSNTTTGIGHWLQSGVGNATGDNTSSGYAPGIPNVGSSSGTNTSTAIGVWLQSAVGSSASSNTATAVPAGAAVTGDGLSIGDNIATAIGAWLQTATGTAIGENVVQGVGPSGDFSNDFAGDFAGYPGAETGLGTGDFNNDFNNDFAVFHVGQIVSGVGTSVGGNIATAVGSTVVFIPPVYPPVVVPVKVWHPAQEYHRVQAPRATRVYRRGTELQRRPPQGMKRRYG